MRKILFIVCLLILSTVPAFAATATPDTPEKTPVLAIIPYLNTTEEKKDYIRDIIEANFASEFPAAKFAIVPATELQKALKDAGYDASNMELPEKDVLASVAKAANADYVVAMEISQLISTRHTSFFSTKVETKAKLRYKFYNAAQDKFTPFQTTGDFENSATLIGDVGYKEPITRALHKAMSAAYEKILTYL